MAVLSWKWWVLFGISYLFESGNTFFLINRSITDSFLWIAFSAPAMREKHLMGRQNAARIALSCWDLIPASGTQECLAAGSKRCSGFLWVITRQSEITGRANGIVVDCKKQIYMRISEWHLFCVPRKYVSCPIRPAIWLQIYGLSWKWNADLCSIQQRPDQYLYVDPTSAIWCIFCDVYPCNGHCWSRQFDRILCGGKYIHVADRCSSCCWLRPRCWGITCSPPNTCIHGALIGTIIAAYLLHTQLNPLLQLKSMVVIILTSAHHS